VTDATLTRDEITKRLIAIVVKEGMIDEAKITPDATLKSLELDSIAIVSILMAVEEQFDVYVPMDGSLSADATLQSLVDNLANQIREKQAKAAQSQQG
jgi:acyl carrier protein